MLWPCLLLSLCVCVYRHGSQGSVCIGSIDEPLPELYSVHRGKVRAPTHVAPVCACLCVSVCACVCMLPMCLYVGVPDGS
jgi:hypothetical protein